MKVNRKHILYALVVVVVVGMVSVYYIQKRSDPGLELLRPTIHHTDTKPPNVFILDSVSRERLLEETNRQREAYGLNALNIDERLNMSAQDKCEDMVRRDYWSHNTPDGYAPWIFIDRYVMAYQKVGENLATGFINNKSIIDGWLESPTHKAILLEPQYTLVGFGLCDATLANKNVVNHLLVQHLMLQ